MYWDLIKIELKVNLKVTPICVKYAENILRIELIWKIIRVCICQSNNVNNSNVFFANTHLPTRRVSFITWQRTWVKRKNTIAISVL